MGVIICGFFLAIYTLSKNYLAYPFTRDPELIQLFDESIIFVLILHGLDFMQTIIFGTIKALALQRTASLINLLSYYLIALPLAYLLSSHSLAPVLPHLLSEVAKGQRGLWIGVLLGMVVHACGYVVLVHGCGSGRRW